MGTLCNQQIELRFDALQALQSAGVPQVTVTPSDTQNFQLDVAQYGLPPRLVADFQQLGLDDSAISSIRDQILASPPPTTAASFPDMLADPELLSALQGGATALLSAPTLTIASNTGSTTYGQSQTFTATVSSGTDPVTNGTITFREGSTILAGPLALDGSGHASFMTSTLSASDSSHVITADYNVTPQSTLISATTSVMVNRAAVNDHRRRYEQGLRRCESHPDGQNREPQERRCHHGHLFHHRRRIQRRGHLRHRTGGS